MLGTMTRFDLISAVGGAVTAIALSAAHGSDAATTTQQAFTIANAGTFAVPAPMVAESMGLGCTIYNLSNDMMWVYFGSFTTASLGPTGNSIPLPPGANLPCNSGNFVPTDAIQITSSTLTGAAGIFISQK